MPATAEPVSAHDLTPAQLRALNRSPRQAMRHGLIQSLPFLLVLGPFGLLFGVVSAETGLDLAQALGFSALVLAGASQFTAVQLLSDQAPVLIVVVTAVAVNLRMAMYSAALVPWLGGARPRDRGLIAYLLVDQSFAMAVQHYERNPKLTIQQRLGYFFGASIGCCVPWVMACAAGFLLGRAIPQGLALDFAVPITFLALIGPMLRTVAHMAAALVAIVASLAFAWLPSGTGLFIAAPLAMVTGAMVEVWIERQRGERA